MIALSIDSVEEHRSWSKVGDAQTHTHTHTVCLYLSLNAVHVRWKDNWTGQTTMGGVTCNEGVLLLLNIDIWKLADGLIPRYRE